MICIWNGAKQPTKIFFVSLSLLGLSLYLSCCHPFVHHLPLHFIHSKIDKAAVGFDFFFFRSGLEEREKGEKGQKLVANWLILKH